MDIYGSVPRQVSCALMVSSSPRGRLRPDKDCRLSMSSSCGLRARERCGLELQGGLTRWQDGQLRNYPAGPGSVNAVIADANSVVWVGRGGLANPEARVCSVEGARLHCYSSADGLELPTTLCCVFSLLKDRQGALWIAGDTGLVRWNAAGSTLYQPEVLQTNQRQPGALLAETHGGTVLVGMTRAGRGGGLQMIVTVS